MSIGLILQQVMNHTCTWSLSESMSLCSFSLYMFIHVYSCLFMSFSCQIKLVIHVKNYFHTHKILFGYQSSQSTWTVLLWLVSPSLLVLTGYEWQKEIETYFLLLGCRGHLGSTRPGGDKGPGWDVVAQKVYAIIWFLVDPNHCSPPSPGMRLGKTHCRVPKGQHDKLAHATPGVLLYQAWPCSSCYQVYQRSTFSCVQAQCDWT